MNALARAQTSLKSLGKIARRRRTEPKAASSGAPKKIEKAPNNAPVVAMIHGLAVPSQVMLPMKWRLQYQHHRKCLNLQYDWYYHDIPRTAEAISRQLLQSGLKEIDVVTHSMGGVILRWAFNHFPMPKIRRVVMISPPNQGSWTANYLAEKTGPIFPMVFGQAGMQLRPGQKGITSRAGLLNGVELGIIAGGAGTKKGKRNIFGIPGDCDGTVAVEETILPGMKDFVLLNYDHSRILYARQTVAMVNSFLEHGIFRSDRHKPTRQELPTPGNVTEQLEMKLEVEQIAS